MPLAYRQPGIQIEESASPQISPLLAAPADVCLVGPSQGYQVRVDQFKLTGTTALALPGLPAGSALSSVVSVKDAQDPTKGAGDGSGYVVTTDYTVSTSNGTITRVGGGGIADGTLVNVTYQYVPSDYWQPMRLYDQGAVESRFGSAVTSDGLSINSPVSYGAAVAFENGAPSVVIQPLFVRATPGDPTSQQLQPNSTQAAATTTWGDTLYVLRDIEDINIIVPIVGQSMPNVADATQLAILQTIQDHINLMRQQDQYIMALFGEDASAASNVATKSTLRTHAVTLAGRYGGAVAEQTVMISPAKFRRSLPVFGQTIFVGGQYAAAGVGGMLASRPVSSALTRKVLSGFVEVSDPRLTAEKDIDAASGLCVIEQRRGLILVRHGITLNTSRVDKREISVIRAKHRMVESIRDTLDSQIIGNLNADQQAPFIVAMAVEGVLGELLQGRDIVDYSRVEARILTLEPTTIEVKFSYRPAFPVNYINVIFNVDLTNGAVTPQTL